MDKRYVYLPGGNPSSTFTEAARAIMERAMPYMGKYNELFSRNSRPHQSIARGLTSDLGVPVEAHNLFFAHGVKESMMYSARFIEWLCRDLKKAIREQGREPPKFKFLIRTPTYKHVKEQFEGYPNFECKFVSSYDQNDVGRNGHLNHLNLLEELESDSHILNQHKYGEFEYTIGFLDINPCNPSGYVRNLSETRETAQLLKLAKMTNEIYLREIFGVQVSFKRTPFVVVEDHIYRGLEYAGNKTVSFCQVDEGLRDCAHTVFGVAKYGLVGMRGSVTVAPKFDVDCMQAQFDKQNSDISPFSVLSCEYMFGDNKRDVASREKYLKKKTSEYERAALISTAIIDGKARDFLSPAEYETATSWLTKHGKLSEGETHKLLEDGIPGINVVNLPRAGFFLLLNFDDLIDFADDEQQYQPENIARFIRATAHYQSSMNIGDAKYMGLSDEFDTVMRFTVAVPPAQLIENLMRLRSLSELIKNVGPINSEKVPDARDPFSVLGKLKKGNYVRINWGALDVKFE